MKQYYMQVNDVLSHYIAVHDDVFKFSIRRIIPIPYIFKKIDYGAHVRELDGLVNELGDIISEVEKRRNEPGDHSVNVATEELEEYSRALLEAILNLHTICAQLYTASKGIAEYPKEMLNQDKSVYEESVRKYAKLGERINSVYQQL